ncbi:MAG: glycoside hydrolase family 15 protein, partial [Limisphaerales bacterium]
MSNRRNARFKPIENYGVIGDLHTVALVGTDASIDFMCFPEFDSPTIFAALLDPERGGSFQLSPVLDRAHHKQMYMPDSNILLTRFQSEDGMVEVSDFMAIQPLGHSHDLVRRIKCIRGDVPVRMLCEPRFDYGRAEHQVENRKHEVLFISKGADNTVLRLRTPVPIKIRNGAAVAEFKLRSGESAAFVLEDASPDRESPSAAPDYSSDAFKETINYWRDWVRHSHYRGRWREMVNRSALALKLLTSARYGSIVAAPTFGLPEEPGGVRNWDYRYTWVRDASFTIYALMRLGYTEEAGAFMRWIEERCANLKPHSPLQVMYRIDGSHNID